MWTPRRLLLLILGFGLCLGAYEVYSLVLGQYDGLPPLPHEYRAVLKPDAPLPDPVADQELRQHEIVRLLEKAFGPRCPERDRKKKLEIGEAKNRKVFAFDEYKFVDGQLKLNNVSLAIFTIHPPEKNEPEREEIVTLRGDAAWIKFNQPVADLWEFKKKGIKPIAGHIEGKEIVLTHNRGTSQRADDITVFCWDRVDFVDEQHRIWSEGKVIVVVADPPESKFEGSGLTITLVSELLKKTDKPEAKPAGRNESLNLGAVKSVRLDRDVEFSFFKLQGSLLGAGLNAPATETKSEKEAVGPGQPLVVRCKDAFEYDAAKQTVTFQTNVNALRYRTQTTPEGPRQSYDELNADEKLVLELQPAAPKNNSGKETDGETKLELKRAIATGKTVKLTVNESTGAMAGKKQGIQAIGTYLECDNVKHEATLKGGPQVMAWMREYQVTTPGVIKLFLPAPEEAQKDIKGLKIIGAGDIKLRPTPEQPEPYPLASWQRELQWHRLGTEQRVELQGSAVFMHEKQGRLAGEQLKVWLTAIDQHPAERNVAGQTEMLGNQENLRLQRLEAEGAVSVLSSKLVIPHAQKLHLTFSPAPEGFLGQGNSDRSGVIASDSVLGSPTRAQKPTTPPAPNALTVDALSIDGEVLMVKDQPRALRRLTAEEKVHIERKPEPGKQNGLDLRGQRLDMNLIGNSDLYKFKLFGSRAIIQTEKFVLQGNQLDLDQLENSLTVPGPGTFKFLTDRNFQGSQLAKPEEVEFTWDEQMNFGGKVAVFLGNVQAEIEKEGVTLSCQKMTATLDRAIRLAAREGEGQQPHAVGLESLVCDSKNKVVIEQRINPGTPQRHVLRIEGVQVVFDNMNKGREIFRVFGPGELNLVRAGGGPMDLTTLPDAKTSTQPAPANARLMLTRVLFEEEMTYQKPEGSLKFRQNVRAFHVPGDDIAMPLSETKLPKGSLYLAADSLQIDAERGPTGRTAHLMEANGNIQMRANQDSYVKANRLTYDEAKGIVRMYGNPAKLYRQERPGAPFQVAPAEMFIYDKNSGKFEAVGAQGIQFK